MKKMATIISLLCISLTVFATDNSVIVSTRLCQKIEKDVKICKETSNEGEQKIYAFSVSTKDATIEVSSDKTYPNVDPSSLTEGLTIFFNRGLSSGEVAHIIGPVADDIKDAVSNSYGLTIAGVTADLAEFLSKRK